MYSHDYRDVIGGCILAAIGIFWGIYAQTHYELGTLHQMNSGMFPMWLGYLLAALGILIVIMALVKKGEYEFPKVDWWTLGVVLASVAIFAFCVRRVGIIPAIVLQVLVVTFADNKLNLFNRLFLAAVLTLMAYLVFYVLLALPLHLFEWRF